MSTLLWILASGVAMSALALVGSVTFMLSKTALQRLLQPMAAFAAGTLIATALLHMLPAALERMPSMSAMLWVIVGFSTFLALEQFVHWHHCRQGAAPHKHASAYLILVGDGLHNFIDGIAIGSAFMIDTQLGLTAWVAAAAHEVPQELADFGVLIHAGWSRRNALIANFLSGLTFLLGGLLAYALSATLSTDFLVPVAAGAFLYVGASDLVPEVAKTHSTPHNVLYFAAFAAGILTMLLLAVLH